MTRKIESKAKRSLNQSASNLNRDALYLACLTGNVVRDGRLSMIALDRLSAEQADAIFEARVARIDAMFDRLRGGK